MKSVHIQGKLKEEIFYYEKAGNKKKNFCIIKIKVKKFAFFSKTVELVFPGSLGLFIAGLTKLGSIIVADSARKMPKPKSLILKLFWPERYHVTSVTYRG